MLVTDLPKAIKEAKGRLKKIMCNYPQISVYLVLSTPDGQAAINSTLETLLDQCDYFFIDSDSLIKSWDLLDELWEINEFLRAERSHLSYDRRLQYEQNIQTLKQKFESLVPLIEIDDEVEICLRWEEIDFSANRKLGCDGELVDVCRSNTRLGGIKICLGTISQLAKAERKMFKQDEAWILMTSELERKFEEVGRQEIANSLVLARWYAPWSNWTGYGIAYEPEDKICFGLIVGFEIELGYFSLTELETIRGPFGLRIERDLSWQETDLESIR